MRAAALALAFALAACAAPRAPAIPPPTAAEIPGLVEGAASGDRAAALRLRAAGPSGLRAIVARYDAAKDDPALRARLGAILDTVSGQKDARASRLYWYTDLEEAKAEARATGRPILSLRLLGRLDEELSCANSRFFRTALYPNQAVNALLRDRFVLHWSTERPAPVITIDFGDGRTIKRTVTGNSLHYVLDAKGRVVDAIPGLYGPEAFRTELARVADISRALDRLDDNARARSLAQYHQVAYEDRRAAWPQLSRTAGVAQLPFPPETYSPPAAGQPPSALVAMPIAPTKAATETSFLKGTMPTPAPVPTVDIPWSRFRSSFATMAKLDANSIALMKEKSPRNWTDASAMGKPLTDAELDSVLRGFEASMAEDTAKNELFHHAMIHRWLADAATTRSGDDDFAKLNSRVYSELFKTPASDPWLGLVPPSVFTGIQDDGVVR